MSTIILLVLCHEILGSCNIYFILLINVYAGVFVGDFFCLKGFVLLGGQQVYLSVSFENCPKIQFAYS